MKRLQQFFIFLLMISLFPQASFASGLELTAEFKEGQTVPLTLKSSVAKVSVSETLGPGDEVESEIKFKNPSNKPIQVTIADIEVQSKSRDSDKFLKAIELEIKEGSGTVYKGSFQKITSPVINYINLQPKEEKKIIIFHRLPKDLDNSYQGSSLKTNWVFEARADVPEDVHKEEEIISSDLGIGGVAPLQDPNQPIAAPLAKKRMATIRAFVRFSDFPDAEKVSLFLFKNGAEDTSASPIEISKTEDLTEARFKVSSYQDSDFFEVKAKAMKGGAIIKEKFLIGQILTDTASENPDVAQGALVQGYLDESFKGKKITAFLLRNGEIVGDPMTPPSNQTGLISFSTTGKLSDQFEIKVKEEGSEDLTPIRNSIVYYDINDENVPLGGASFSGGGENPNAPKGEDVSFSFGERDFKGEVVKTADVSGKKGVAAGAGVIFLSALLFLLFRKKH